MNVFFDECNYVTVNVTTWIEVIGHTQHAYFSVRWSVVRAFPPARFLILIFWLTEEAFIFQMKHDVRTS